MSGWDSRTTARAPCAWSFRAEGTTTRRVAAIAGFLMFAALAGAAGAQVAVTSERVSFRVAEAPEKGAGVTAELRVPGSPPAALPAVLILTSTPGFDGRGAFYAEALNRAGIATLEADVFEGKGQSVLRHHFAQAFAALAWLARHPRVDAARVGIMGFSTGGAIAILASSDEVARKHGGDRRFAAHLGVYPHCWVQRRILAGDAGGIREGLVPSTWKAVTGRPVHILVGARDVYDMPDLCQRFVDALLPSVRAQVGLTVLPDATFAWDSRVGSATWSAGAHDGRGGMVEVVADPAIAQRSRDVAVAYFRKHLAVE